MLTGYTVMIRADDSQSYRKLGWVLEHKGCRVLSLGSDTTRWGTLNLREFDLILARVDSEDGEELTWLQQVKSLHPQVRVILCSRNGETAFPVEAYQLEVDDYLLMPCRLAELWRRVVACLKRAAAKTGDLALKSPGAAGNRGRTEKSRPLCDYFRYNLGASATALENLLHSAASSLDKKLMAKIYEVSARLEVLQEMTDGFLQGIPGAETLTVSLPERNYGQLPGYPG